MWTKWARFGVGLAVASALIAGAAPAVALPADGSVAIEQSVDCQPSNARPYPVIVLPGADGTTAQTGEQWATMLTALRHAGACTLVFQGGVVNGQRWAGDMVESAQQLARYVTDVKARTHAAKVDIVAHSAGTFAANYFLKVLHGAPDVHDAVFLAPEARGCDGAGFLAQYGIPKLPITPVQAITAMPWLVPVLSSLMPSMRTALELTPASEVYRSVMDGQLTQPGVRYAVVATRNDAVATPPGTCSFIDEPGVTNVFYEDLFPHSPAVDHSSLRSSPQTAQWVVSQLNP
ncbi:hypothetical protein FOS14_11160 [Skermania sp. ID1734]|uniref:esterase/lipase family protein n=1 Tax=Skermania sp. ID1734 TaxID=2597516 RepID=UPI00117C5F70|nr:hypothetical protein [Skermania sp. ID1734]TSD99795.1 hypothetical protein FOS14_11160 [Skermania sp. ID1734]